MGEWYSVLGDGVVLSGHEIYRRIRIERGTSALGMASSASWELADRYAQRAAQIDALTQKLAAAWEGSAAGGATSAMRPATTVFADSRSLLMTSRDALVDQAHGYWTAYGEVQYVPPTAPTLFDGYDPGADIDRAIADYNDKAQRNVQVYNTYHHQSVANGDRMPAAYPTAQSGETPSVTVAGGGEDRAGVGGSGEAPAGPASAGPPSTGSVSLSPGAGGGWGAGSGQGGAGAPDGLGTQPQSWGQQGPPTAPSGGVPTDPRPAGSSGWGSGGAPGWSTGGSPGGGPGGSSGWGPGGSSGWGPGGSVGWGLGGSVGRGPGGAVGRGPGGSTGWGPGGSAGPGAGGTGARGGTEFVPPGSGGAVGRLTPDGRGGVPRGGGVVRPVNGSGVTPGSGMWGAPSGRRDDDQDHYRRYGRQLDSDELFDIGLVVSHPVIGAEPDDDLGDLGDVRDAR